MQRKLKERRRERKRIDTSYLRNAVIKETGLRIESYGGEVARSYSLGDRMEWNSKPSPPPTPSPEIKNEAVRKRKPKRAILTSLIWGEGDGV